MFRKLPVIALVLLSLSPVLANVQVGSLMSTQRLLRNDAPPSGRKVDLYIARNEWRSFQIFVRSASPVRITSVDAGDLHGPGGSIIPASTARLYREHQFYVTVPTYRNANFVPGWYPDALIPFRNPLNGEVLTGARFTAVPFDLPANETYGFWVDIFIPGNARPGRYTGKYRVRFENQPAVTVPISLTVWNFKLPDTPTLVTHFESPSHRLPGYYANLKKIGKHVPIINWNAVDSQCAQMLAENRLDAVPDFSVAPELQPDGSYAIPNAEVTELRNFIDHYHINMFNIPHPKYFINDPDQAHGKLVAWFAAWDKAISELNRRQVTFCIYLFDEPNTKEEYEYVRKWGEAIHSTHTSVKVLVTEQPKTQDPAWGNLYGSVDIWCPLFSLFDGPTEAQRQAKGETIWTYTALCQGDPTPWWQTDFPLLNYRVPAWISWRYHIRGLLYWGGMCYWNNVDDPWTDPLTYGSHDPEKPGFNGEGNLVYPAIDVGYDGLVPSMRLKAIRNSIEDYEYMSILEREGKSAAADRIVRPLAESWHKWEKNPDAYDSARIELANLILGKGSVVHSK